MHIGGKRGQSIVAAARGEVVYAGSGLPGYGQLLIIKHTSDYLSAYGHNQTLLVGEGDQVQGGQVIARMGEGPGQRPLLHFEIRRGGQPANPLGYLPKPKILHVPDTDILPEYPSSLPQSPRKFALDLPGKAPRPNQW